MQTPEDVNPFCCCCDVQAVIKQHGDQMTVHVAFTVEKGADRDPHVAVAILSDKVSFEITACSAARLSASNGTGCCG